MIGYTVSLSGENMLNVIFGFIFLVIYTGGTMTEERFWALIEQTKKSAVSQDSFSEILISELIKLNEEEVTQFEIILRDKINEANHFNVMIPLKIIEGYVSDENYLYFRCWLISQGREVFNASIIDSDYLAGIVTKGTAVEFEDLLYVSTSAYSQLVGREEDEEFPRDVAIEKGHDYDFMAPPTRGEDWQESDLPIRAPKLWKMFNE